MHPQEIGNLEPPTFTSLVERMKRKVCALFLSMTVPALSQNHCPFLRTVVDLVNLVSRWQWK